MLGTALEARCLSRCRLIALPQGPAFLRPKLLRGFLSRDLSFSLSVVLARRHEAVPLDTKLCS